MVATSREVISNYATVGSKAEIHAGYTVGSEQDVHRIE